MSTEASTTVGAVRRIVCAPDSFKGSLSAADAAAALARGAAQVFPEARITDLPFADGGEGTLDALLAVWGTPATEIAVVDALGRPASALYGISADGKTAVIEAAQANGLPQVSDVELQPGRADTSGVGLIARHAIAAGVDEILLCIGGSASTDGGAGIAQALGVRFLDASGAPIPPGGFGLSALTSIDTSGLDPRAARVRWRIAVDVDNPLIGPRGAAAVFGPQKGAEAADVAALDAGLSHFAAVLRDSELRSTTVGDSAAHASAAFTSLDPATTPGFGAAGGIALALTALLGAEVVPGSQMVAETVGLAEALADADLVLTGEGSFDSQSLGGKVVAAVRHYAPARVPVVVIAGRVGLTPAECREAGITAALSIAPGPAELSTLSAEAAGLIEDTAAHACNLLSTGL